MCVISAQQTAQKPNRKKNDYFLAGFPNLSAISWTNREPRPKLTPLVEAMLQKMQILLLNLYLVFVFKQLPWTD